MHLLALQFMHSLAPIVDRKAGGLTTAPLIAESIIGLIVYES